MQHGLELTLIHPQIAPNAGNIGRLCVATNTSLHIVRPMGFVLDDKRLRRSAMDYWPRLKLTMHDDGRSFFQAMASKKLWFFDSSGCGDLWDTTFTAGDVLIFGSETRGFSEAILRDHAGRIVRIPQAAGERCLNLSTAAGIALYEAMRQVIIGPR